MSDIGDGGSGLACLTTMMRFHGIAVDPDRISHRFAAQRLGLAEIVRGAREHGLKAKVTTVRPQRLRKVVLPAVFRTRDGSFQILAKAAEGGVLVHNPANGRPGTMSLDAFLGL